MKYSRARSRTNTSTLVSPVKKYKRAAQWDSGMTSDQPCGQPMSNTMGRRLHRETAKVAPVLVLLVHLLLGQPVEKSIVLWTTNR